MSRTEPRVCPADQQGAPLVGDGIVAKEDQPTLLASTNNHQLVQEEGECVAALQKLCANTPPRCLPGQSTHPAWSTGQGRTYNNTSTTTLSGSGMSRTEPRVCPADQQGAPLVGDGIVAKELAKGPRRNELNTPGTHHFAIHGQLAASARDKKMPKI
ncbi:hypothetical protein Ddc_18210 [Ditylenchus destructor]|nr:hypothetical protein Ddc_18210 [Ditylenchus destructor]